MQRQAEDRLDALALWLQTLVQGRPVLTKTIEDLATAIQQDAEGGSSITWYAMATLRPAHWAAASGLHAAQVIARLGRGHDLGAATKHDVLVAALVHDAGMAGLSEGLLQHAGPLTEAQSREMEAHAGLAAEGLRRLVPQEAWLIEAVLAHHERMDGTGYPKGKLGKDLPRLARLLGVVDVYAASQCARPYRPALTPRAALTETLLEAERGRLDAAMAELLLELSFYPPGTHVELSDGRIAVVVATQHLVQDLTAPARPIVQVVADAEGTPAALPIHLNLAQCPGLHVVRSLPRPAPHQLSARLSRSPLAA
jgi:response regulator RpfG family c-di-GMP phosphodiesterase